MTEGIGEGGSHRRGEGAERGAERERGYQGWRVNMEWWE